MIDETPAPGIDETPAPGEAASAVADTSAVTDDIPVLDEPAAVAGARALAERLGFQASCTPGTGRLLATLAAAVTGPVAESGSGCGYGTAWLRSGLRAGERLVTVERDAQRAAAVAELFAADPAVVVLHDDWAALRAYSPFGLFFVDGGGKSDGPDAVADLMAPGGIVVLDDFTPNDTWNDRSGSARLAPRRDPDWWPPMYLGQPDALRLAWLTDPRFVTVEVRTEADHAALISTRRA
jgi:predicted O-methyltransferase YrrM